MLFCIILGTLSVIGFYFATHSFYALLVAFICYGFSINQLLPFVEAVSVEKFTKPQYGKIRSIGSSGFICAALLIPYFSHIHFFPIHGILVATSLANLSLLGFLALTKGAQETTESSQKNSFSFRSIWWFWVVIFLMQFSFGGFYNFFTIYATEHSIDLQMTSYLWVFGVICEIGILYYQGYFLSKFSDYSLFFVCFLASFVRWILIFLFPSNVAILFFSQSLHALNFALFHSTCIYFISKHYANKKLAQQFYLGISFGLGGFVGGQFAGVFYGKYLFLYEALFSLLALLIVFSQLHKRRAVL